MRMTRGFGLVMLSLLFIGGVAIAGSFVLRGEARIPNELKGIALSKPVPLDRRTFMSTNGEAVFPVPSRRKWTFLVVGYAHCPDICPFILENLAEVETQMLKSVPKAKLPRFVFLSVDPLRDTTDFLKNYVKHFSDRLVGMTGDAASIDGLTQQIGAFYRLGKPDSEGFYPVDHSGEVFLIDPTGRLFAKFKPPLDADETVDRFLGLTAHFQAAQL